MHSHASMTKSKTETKKSPQRKTRFRVVTNNDAYETEADRIADMIIGSKRPPNNNQMKTGNFPFISPLTRTNVSRVSVARLQRPGNGRRMQRAVNEPITSAGNPLPSSTRRFMESRIGHDFSDVRIHTDSRANAWASALNAQAYTIGNNVVFAHGRYSPATTEGQQLLAHELTHVIQQRQSSLYLDESDHHNIMQCKGGTVSGFFRNLGRSIASLFGDELRFDEAELQEYLGILDTTNDIEDDYHSDDKARAVVRAWISGNSPFVLTPQRIILLIREMQSGATGNADENAILELLERSENSHLNRYFGEGGLNLQQLNEDFHGDEWDKLQDFYERRFVGGLSALQRGQVEARGRAVPLGTPLSQREQTPAEAQASDQVAPEATCNIRSPGNCHSFEAWIRLFGNLPQFPARSGHRAIGPARAPRATATDPTAAPSARRPFVRHSRSEYMPHDRFIDGPTDQWVREHLPPNLVASAYELPSDCADMAVILRHVWLVAHRRTEVYRGWLCGTALDDPRTGAMRDMLRGGRTHRGDIVWSGTVSRIVRPYRGPSGNVIRDFPTLQRLLHPGDVLVWDHPAPRGGHTHTIMGITRTGDRVNRLDLLQGNEPINAIEARNILIREYGFREAQLPAGRQSTWPQRAQDLERQLRTAPGRRIEVGRLQGDNLPHDDSGVWTIWGGSQLVAAGPPASSEQPAVRRGRTGQDRIRGLSDWTAELSSAADLAALQSRVEAALLETRSLLEAGHGRLVSQADARTFGRTAGERLWALANEVARTRMRQAERRRSSARIRERDLLGEHLAEESHYRPLLHMARMMQQVGRDARVATMGALMRTAAAEFERAARGTTSIGFGRTARERRGSRVAAGAQLSNVLLTGFDPFQFRAGRQIAPERGRFNPSGAAILQLDGTTIPVDTDRAAAVEGVVLPVDYRAFTRGLIETRLGPQVANSDAVITVSESPGRDPNQPLRVERFAVGVHRLRNDRLEAIPAAPGSSDTGPAIIESGPGVAEIVEAVNPAPEQNHRPIADIGTTVRFRFINATQANRALRALGLSQSTETAEVDIDDVSAIQQIVNTMQRGVQSSGIVFQAGNQSFQAFVLRGPGGAFLSNEVSYRMLRLIAASGQSRTSFHVHTPRGTREVYGRIPQDVTGEAEARRQAQEAGRQRPTTAESRGARETARRRRFAALELGRRVVRRVVDGLKALIRAVVRRLP